MSRSSKLLDRLFLFVAASLLLIITTTTDAYNVDTRTLRIFRGPPHSKFGFSVAQHKEESISWLIIGAPEADVNVKGGAVYKCNPENHDSCSVFIGSMEETKGQRVGQWLGATVLTSGVDGVILACAPRYAWYGKSSDRTNIYDPVGSCYLTSENFTNNVEFSPCRHFNSTGYHRTGHCQAGMSASISQDSKRLYLGAVGSWYWHGQVFSMMKDVVYDQYFEYYASQITMLSASSFTSMKATKEGLPSEDYIYKGYSMANIKLPVVSSLKDKFEDGIVTGAPRADSADAYLTGKVLVYTWNLTEIKTLIGQQFGSYFGHSVCVADVDGDRKQDIIVGAPLHTEKNNVGLYEVGRVYVYYQGGYICNLNDLNCWKNTFIRYTALDGYSNKGRFGNAVASLGDINKDDYEDFAVGAPYETEDGYRSNCEREPIYSGTVYIYHGSVNGVRKQPSQILRARDVSAVIGMPRLTSFGFSIGGGIDLDDNYYPDVTVGAYDTDAVYHFRSKPVVRVMANLTYLMDPKYIDINQTVSSPINLRLCLKYSGIGVHPTSVLSTVISLDSLKPNSSRLINQQHSSVISENFTLTKDGILCRDYVTVLKGKIVDKLTPIVADLSYSLVDVSYSELGQVLDTDYMVKHNDSLFIRTNCGDDNKCIADLRLKLTSDIQKYTIGSGKDLIINVTVQNQKDDSFETKLYLYMPPGVGYVNFEQNVGTGVEINCNSQETILICDLGNPLPGRTTIKFGLRLQPAYGDTKMSKYTFLGTVNCTNPDFKQIPGINTNKTFALPIWENTTLSLTGQSYPNVVHYKYSDYHHSASDSMEKDVQAGPPLDHKYTIQNMGPSGVSTADVIIYWPSYTYTGDNLLYLLYEPDVKGNVSCSSITDINPRSLKLVWDRHDYFYGRGSSGSSVETSTKKEEVIIKSNETITLKNDSSIEQTYVVHREDSRNSINRPLGMSGGGTVGKDVSKGSTEKILFAGEEGKQQQQQQSSTSYKYESGNHGEGRSYDKRVENNFEIRSSGHDDRFESTDHDHDGNGRRFIYSDRTENGDQTSAGGTSGVGRIGGTNIEGSQRQSSALEEEKSSASSGGPYEAQSRSEVGGSSDSGYKESRKHIYTEEEKSSAAGSRQHLGKNYEDELRRRNYEERRRVQGGRSSVDGSSSSNLNNIYSGYTETPSRSLGSAEQSGVYNRGGLISGVGNTDGLKNQSYVRSSHHSHSSNTTWEDGFAKPKTVVQGKWSIEENGNVRNGSYKDGEGYLMVPRVIDYHPSIEFSQDHGLHHASPVSSSGREYESSSGIILPSNVGVNIGGVDGESKTSYAVRNSSSSSRNEYSSSSSSGSNNRLNSVGGMHTNTRQQLNVDDLNLNPSNSGEKSIFRNERNGLNNDDNKNNDDDDDDENDGDENDGDENDGDENDGGGDDDTSSTPIRKTRDVKNFEQQQHQETWKADDCSAAKCTVIKCTINHLAKNDSAVIVLRSLVWVKTLKKLAYNREMAFNSKAIVTITEFPHIGKSDLRLNQTFEIFTNVTSDDADLAPDVVPLWIIVLSAVAGTLILLLLIYILYKCGFFERNRPTNEPETQPLNRNGQLRDEQL